MTYKLLLIVGILLIMFGWASCDHQNHSSSKLNKTDSLIVIHYRDSTDSVHYLQDSAVQNTTQTSKIPSNNN